MDEVLLRGEAASFAIAYLTVSDRWLARKVLRVCMAAAAPPSNDMYFAGDFLEPAEPEDMVVLLPAREAVFRFCVTSFSSSGSYSKSSSASLRLAMLES